MNPFLLNLCFLLVCGYVLLNELSVAVVGLKVNGKSYDSPIFSMGTHIVPSTSNVKLVFSSDKQGCGSLGPDVSGNAVFLEQFGGCTFEDKIRNCQDHGCVGIVYGDEWIRGRLLSHTMMWGFFDFSSRDDLKVPLFSLERALLHEVRQIMKDDKQNNITTTVDFRIISPNAFEDHLKSFAFTFFFQVIFSISHFYAFVLAALKLKEWRSHPKKDMMFAGVAQTCLLIEVFFNLARGFYFAIDPLNAKQVVPTPLSNYWLQSPAAWEIVSTILIIFYWGEILNNMSSSKITIEKVTFIRKYKNPFLYICISVIIMDFMLGLGVGRQKLPLWILLLDFSFFVTIYYLCCFFIVMVGVGILKHLKKEANRKRESVYLNEISVTSVTARRLREDNAKVIIEKQNKKVHNMINRIILSGGGAFILSTSLVVIMLSPDSSANFRLFLWWFGMLGNQIMSYAQINSL